MSAYATHMRRLQRALLGVGLSCALAPAALAQAGAQPAPDAKPVYVDEVGRTPDGPPTASDRRYEERVRASFASAQGMQGPLDGHWTLSAAGEQLYALQLVDKHGSALEGAWRDVRRTGATEGSGFLSEIERSGATLTFTFRPRVGGPAMTATLSAADDGRWTGQLSDGTRTRAVEMKRN